MDGPTLYEPNRGNKINMEPNKQQKTKNKTEQQTAGSGKSTKCEKPASNSGSKSSEVPLSFKPSVSKSALARAGKERVKTPVSGAVCSKSTRVAVNPVPSVNKGTANKSSSSQESPTPASKGAANLPSSSGSVPAAQKGTTRTSQRHITPARRAFLRRRAADRFLNHLGKKPAESLTPEELVSLNWAKSLMAELQQKPLPSSKDGPKRHQSKEEAQLQGQQPGTKCPKPYNPMDKSFSQVAIKKLQKTNQTNEHIKNCDEAKKKLIAIFQPNLVKEKSQENYERKEEKQEMRANTLDISQPNLAKEKPKEKLKQIGIYQPKCAKEKPQEKQQREEIKQEFKAKTTAISQLKVTKEKSQEEQGITAKPSLTSQLNSTKENPQEKQRTGAKQTNISQFNISTFNRSTDDPITDDLCMALANVRANGRLQPVTEEWPKIELKMSDILMHYLLHNKDCPIPRYKSGQIYQGFLLIQCQDIFSRNFLCNCILKVREDFKDLNLTIIPASEIPLPNPIVINIQPSSMESYEEYSNLEPPPPPLWSNVSNEEIKSVKKTKNFELSHQHALQRLEKLKQRNSLKPRHRKKIAKCFRTIRNYEMRKCLQTKIGDVTNNQLQAEGFQLSENYFEKELKKQHQQTEDKFKQLQTEGFQLSVNYFETDLNVNKDKEQLIQQPPNAKGNSLIHFNSNKQELYKESSELTTNNFIIFQAEAEYEPTPHNPFKDNNFHISFNSPTLQMGALNETTNKPVEKNRYGNSTRTQDQKREDNHKRRLRFLRKLSQFKELTPRQMKYKILNEKLVRKYEEHMAIKLGKPEPSELPQTLQGSQKYFELKQTPDLVTQEEMLEFIQNSGNFDKTKSYEHKDGVPLTLSERRSGFESEFPSTSRSNKRTNSLGNFDDFERGNLKTNLFDSQTPACPEEYLEDPQCFMRNTAQILPKISQTNISRNSNDADYNPLSQIFAEFPQTSRRNMGANCSWNSKDSSRENFNEMPGNSNHINPSAQTYTGFSHTFNINMTQSSWNSKGPERESFNVMRGNCRLNNFTPTAQKLHEFSQTSNRNMTVNSSLNSKDSVGESFNEMSGNCRSNNLTPEAQTLHQFPNTSQRNMKTNNTLNFLDTSRRSQTISSLSRQPNKSPNNSDKFEQESLKSKLEKRILECLNNLNEEILEDQLTSSIQEHKISNLEETIREEIIYPGTKLIRDHNHQSNFASSILKRTSEEHQIENIHKGRTNQEQIKLTGSSSLHLKRKSECPVEEVMILSDDSENSDIEELLKKSENLRKYKGKMSEREMINPIIVSPEKSTRWNSHESPRTKEKSQAQQQGFKDQITTSKSDFSTSFYQSFIPAVKHSYPSIKSNSDLQIAIIDRNEPDFKIRKETWLKLEKDLLECLLKEMHQTNNTNIGMFDAMYWRYGIKIVQCENKESLEFIKRFIHNQDLYWPGTEFDVIPIKDLPRRSIVKVWIPPPLMDDNGVLKLLKAQNTKFYSLDWTLINSRERNNKNGKDLYVSISATSLERLRKRKGEIRFGINHLQMILPEEESREEHY